MKSDDVSSKATREIRVGDVAIGGHNDIAIQSMCITKTHDVADTVAQILSLEDEGCDIIRVAVPDQRAVDALPAIKKQIHIPLVADIHYSPKLAIQAIKNGADKIRINPGNIGSEDQVRAILETAKSAGVPIRIGVNAGSLERDILERHQHPTAEAMVESAMRWIGFFERERFDNIVVSLKSADVQTSIDAQRMIAGMMPYPLHIGVTEAGTLVAGIVRTAIGLSTLLRENIGDTFRVSITEDPVTQVRIAKEILRTLGLREQQTQIVSCPSCGRAEVDIRKIALEVEERANGLGAPLKIAVMGCVVNAAGEAREADYGIGCGKGRGAIFKKGVVIKTADEDKLVSELFRLIDEDTKGNSQGNESSNTSKACVSA